VELMDGITHCGVSLLPPPASAPRRSVHLFDRKPLFASLGQSSPSSDSAGNSLSDC